MSTQRWFKPLSDKKYERLLQLCRRYERESIRAAKAKAYYKDIRIEELTPAAKDKPGKD